MPRRTEAELKALWERHWHGKESLTSISKDAGVSRQALSELFKRRGWMVRGRGRKKGAKNPKKEKRTVPPLPSAPEKPPVENPGPQVEEKPSTPPARRIIKF